MKRLAGDLEPLPRVQRFERGAIAAAHAGGELGRLLVALDERALDFLVVRQAAECHRPGRKTQHDLHSTSSARISRTLAAKSSTARASVTRSSTERITV